MERLFSRIADCANRLIGHPLGFALCSLLIAGMVLWGWISGWGSLWGLVSGASTGFASIVLLCLLQHSSNRSTAAVLLKLDVLIAHHQDADNKYLAAEDLSEAQLREMKKAVTQVKG